MVETQRGNRYVVIDDLLPASEFGATGELFEASRLGAAKSAIAPDADGVARRSKGVRLPYTTSEKTGRPPVYTRITQAIREEPGIFGDSGADWNEVSFTFWQYPAGSRLSWHDDSRPARRGAYVFFAHPRWDASWGGELLLIDADSRLIDDGGAGERDERPPIGELIVRAGVNPVAILPRPNRLVLFSSNTFHMVTRVDGTAGEQVRCTLTGFVSRYETPGKDGSANALIAAGLLGAAAVRRP
jgi:hypothetical protein